VKAYLADTADIHLASDQPVLQMRIGSFNG
jgi:hypothetical protein